MSQPDPDVARSVDADILSRPTAARPQRLLSLDVLRGLTIAFMILVNDQAGPHPFAQLSHARWNGFTATDLVFPTFLFLIGISTVLSISARLARGASRQELFVHILRRAALLVLFGFVVNNFPFFRLASDRFYGVLPRIGVCYFVVATLYLISPTWKDKLVLALVCLAGYWALMRFVPVPGFGMPTHTIAINDPDGNLTAWLDRQIFAAPHLYERTRDPEGLLSTLPAIATTLFGLLAGLWLRSAHSMRRKTTLLALAGFMCLALGLLWNPFFPINKKLWTSSYVFFAGGWSLLLLAASIAIVDLLRLGRPASDPDRPDDAAHPWLYKPLLVLGTNAILAYMISELGATLFHLIHPRPHTSLSIVLDRAIVRVIPSPEWSSLVFSLIYLLGCLLLVVPLYRKRIFLRL